MVSTFWAVRRKVILLLKKQGSVSSVSYSKQNKQTTSSNAWIVKSSQSYTMGTIKQSTRNVINIENLFTHGAISISSKHLWQLINIVQHPEVSHYHSLKSPKMTSSTLINSPVTDITTTRIYFFNGKFHFPFWLHQRSISYEWWQMQKFMAAQHTENKWWMEECAGLKKGISTVL